MQGSLVYKPSYVFSGDTFSQCVYRPIHDAIESGCLDLVKVLISHGADPLAEFGEKTPVEYALSIDQKEIYKYLEGLTADISTYLTHSIPCLMHCFSTYCNATVQYYNGCYVYRYGSGISPSFVASTME